MTTAEAIAVQCGKAREEFYRLKALIEQMPHEANRDLAMQRFVEIFDKLERLQDFVTSR